MEYYATPLHFILLHLIPSIQILHMLRVACVGSDSFDTGIMYNGFVKP
jgi:hypothetical protein